MPVTEHRCELTSRISQVFASTSTKPQIGKISMIFDCPKCGITELKCDIFARQEISGSLTPQEIVQIAQQALNNPTSTIAESLRTAVMRVKFARCRLRPR